MAEATLSIGEQAARGRRPDRARSGDARLADDGERLRLRLPGGLRPVRRRAEATPDCRNLARFERDGKMVMYELTERGRALLAAVAAQGIVT